MVYIFACLFSVRNTINLSRNENVLSGPTMEKVSLETVLYDVINLLYIGQTLLKINHKVQWIVKFVKT